ncbi:inorganic phosphate transporter [Candidatus Sulfidibacterium hydrothermale]|uniref:inorganic phosphate transporter n=1 Tax=Candidatus Sulfidibacterium hydrothermale TaxID=2875962 RepID=UPI001F0AA19C|nr:inorganic phosphate transporter [Candidatus Sulfidibacterium hydrothermale]UBM61425.1 inorganic phosphate transporter [Candidatus Sulfidibacterium hydrothermale]
METFYYVMTGILFLLAVFDLVVGVSNDAVNFLNSAIGSKVASFKVIIAVAAMGILFGVVFSSGMMEVARKGIFHPEMFYFSEMMVMFVAVMISTLILLDTFNTLGMPTSTTVSIVFELLGAAVAMAVIKLSASPEQMLKFKQYLFDHHIITDMHQHLSLGYFINSGKALAIISGILVSVAIAFTVGAIIQYIARIIFSFNYQRRVKWFGAIWGGIAFSSITYFILIKGAVNATFISDAHKAWIASHSGIIILYSFVGWSVLLQILNWLFKLNILKTIVLGGTFALAMAFAGNDLVNFIGVPIAGYDAFLIYLKHPGADPSSLGMIELMGKVPTPITFLLMSGVIMVFTLYFSKKAKSVIKTSVDLSRQETGDERFKPNTFSKMLVRSSINMSKGIRKITPNFILQAIEKQFEPYQMEVAEEVADPPAFDLIRASVSLVVASILIAFGTSLKLPLSTTYVTFMVAMGASLADRAWDRESAVYRISGVFSVIGGWFLTALTAFIISFALVYIFHYLGSVSIFVALVLVFYMVYRSSIAHKKKTEKSREIGEEVYGVTEENVSERFLTLLVGNLKNVIREYRHTIEGLEKEDVKKLRKTKKAIDEMAVRTKYIKDHINVVIERLDEMTIDSGSFLVQAMDYMREMLHSISFFTSHALEHVDNNHKPLIPEQISELKHLSEHMETILKITLQSIIKEDFSSQPKLLEEQAKGLRHIESYRKNQIRRIKKKQVGTRNSILYLNLLDETKNLFLQAINLFKAQRDFVNNAK